MSNSNERKEDNPPVNIHQVADYFLSRVDVESGDVMTHLKLQKLAYYSQAWHLAMFGTPLVDEEFQAWVHGPVSRALFSRFADVGFAPIGPDQANPSRISKLSDDAVRHLEEVWRVYGGLTGKALEQRTHDEDPWVEARGDLSPVERSGRVISQATMERFYRAMLSDGEEEEEPRS